MRISRKKPRYKQEIKRKYKTNQFIRVPQIRLIDENGDNIGIIDTDKALTMAKEKGLDLVEVSPVAKPPVAKIVDYSKLRYQEEKERRKESAKKKKIETKGIRLSLRISGHDLSVKINQAKKFLDQGDKVKTEITLKGRERQHKSLAAEVVKKFISELNKNIETVIEQPINIQGGKVTVLIAKK